MAVSCFINLFNHAKIHQILILISPRFDIIAQYQAKDSDTYSTKSKPFVRDFLFEPLTSPSQTFH